jgi:hypothetical protein
MTCCLAKTKELWQGRLEDSVKAIEDNPNCYENWEESYMALKALKTVALLQGAPSIRA